MKKRLGFVSNSSSSSYVIVGVYLSDIDDELSDSIEKRGLDNLFDENEGKHIVGEILSDNSDDSPKTYELDINELQKTFEKVKSELIHLGIDPEEVKLYHAWI